MNELELWKRLDKLIDGVTRLTDAVIAAKPINEAQREITKVELENFYKDTKNAKPK